MLKCRYASYLSKYINTEINLYKEEISEYSVDLKKVFIYEIIS